MLNPVTGIGAHKGNIASAPTLLHNTQPYKELQNAEQKASNT